ncbi:MFS transporter [Actinomycetospora cinnamomea]|uniref:DHA2 family metal-tetracycline-proton antiporter-like MFS transporter n=1 Tax=Actinomycetospora cinnamomea TaxID=663609 RepID=A0A2U1FQQ8_9PSEU|nr:MFS transporter [Actinomycetospora cinnamomea]PVZ14507.1 DHA2 family metal-tetracycline-proton antiporter-like MFS transporter [Actinomycetospora cinnamomea]
MTDPRPSTVEPSPTVGSPEAAPVRTGLLLGVLLVAVAVAVLANSMVLVLVPEIGRDYAASPSGLAWVVTAFSLSFAVATPLYGRIADVFGVRRVFAVGLAIFIVGSLVAGLAPGIGVHLVGRVLQGLGSAAVPALGSVAVARSLPPGRRGFGFGVVGTGVGAGQALGPPLAGLVAEVAGWRWPFLGAALLVAPLLVVAPRVLPDGRPDGGGSWRRIDLVGGVLLGGAVGLGLFGLTRAQQVGLAPSSWGAVVAALVLAAGFVVRIRTTPRPFVPPALLTHGPFVVTVAVGFLAMFCYLGTILLVPLLVATVNGLGVGHVGLVLLPGALAVAVLSSVAGRLSDRLGPRTLVGVGLGVLGLAVTALSTLAGGSAVVLGAITLAVGVGLATITSPLINAVAAAVPEEHAGVGLGLYQGAFFLGGGTGAAVLGTVLAARSGAGGGSWNPLHDGAGAAFADALLVIAAVLVVALLLSRRLPTRT